MDLAGLVSRKGEATGRIMKNRLAVAAAALAMLIGGAILQAETSASFVSRLDRSESFGR